MHAQHPLQWFFQGPKHFLGIDLHSSASTVFLGLRCQTPNAVQPHSQLQVGKAGVKLCKVKLVRSWGPQCLIPPFDACEKKPLYILKLWLPFLIVIFLNWQENPLNNPFFFKLQRCAAFKETQGYAIARTPTQGVWALLLTLIGSELCLSCYSPHMVTRYSCNYHSACVCRMPGTTLRGLCEVR